MKGTYLSKPQTKPVRRNKVKLLRAPIFSFYHFPAPAQPLPDLGCGLYKSSDVEVLLLFLCSFYKCYSRLISPAWESEPPMDKEILTSSGPFPTAPYHESFTEPQGESVSPFVLNSSNVCV